MSLQPSTVAMDARATTKRMSHIEDGLNTLDNRVSAVEERVSVLHDRLLPVLVPQSPRAVDVDSPMKIAQRPEPSGVAKRTEMVIGRLETIEERLRNILEALDL